ELRQKLLDGARTDAETKKGGENLWGAGKLGIGPTAPGTAPTVALTGTAPGGDVSLTATLVDDGDVAAAKSRWDFGYDGTWDVDWQPGLEASTTIEGGAPFLDVKVEVMDADGWLSAAVARVTPTEPEAPPKKGDPVKVTEDGCGCRLPGGAGGAAGSW